MSRYRRVFLLAEVVMQRGSGDGCMAHRDANLVERVNDVARGVDPLPARALLLIDRDAAAITELDAERLRQLVVRI